MACPRARFRKVLLEMNCVGGKFSVFMDLFDQFFPAEKAIHDQEIVDELAKRHEERRTSDRRNPGPAIEGHVIAVIRSIREEEQ